MWNDRWLHEEVGMKVSSSKPERCTVQKVKDLLHQHRVGWNEELLYQFSVKKNVYPSKIFQLVALVLLINSFGTPQRMNNIMSNQVTSGQKTCRGEMMLMRDQVNEGNKRMGSYRRQSGQWT